MEAGWVLPAPLRFWTELQILADVSGSQRVVVSGVHRWMSGRSPTVAAAAAEGGPTGGRGGGERLQRAPVGR